MYALLHTPVPPHDPWTTRHPSPLCSTKPVSMPCEPQRRSRVRCEAFHKRHLCPALQPRMRRQGVCPSGCAPCRGCRVRRTRLEAAVWPAGAVLVVLRVVGAVQPRLCRRGPLTAAHRRPPATAASPGRGHRSKSPNSNVLHVPPAPIAAASWPKPMTVQPTLTLTPSPGLGPAWWEPECEYQRSGGKG